ncbi:hypothetical protein CLV24_12036 [Pontibacter ummariensis]|uniref:GmrSD restriction endonucleases N-terminal domain-containing protein n=2 Tax=Pontibacter ummariensis TaxID=1610492 RepID=A0A239J3I7_9BACT|nr:hypothetical protein CLV24_12036 [Pontibacter ummariensis]SNT00596.1 hypothetical protein SAMN06296052_12035 [Pontibacter ummariensis]
MSLFESLRQGYPIGSFLVMTSEEALRLNPRAFYGTGATAESENSMDGLVLDGQQRITAGLAIYYGVENPSGIDYYINVKKIKELIEERKVDLDSDKSIEVFAKSLDVEDGYITTKPQRKNRDHNFYEHWLLWTGFLTKDKADELDNIVDKLDERDKAILRRVVRRHFSPAMEIPVPVITLGKEFDLGAISKIFTTINTTGKLLTPFELVVAILFPENVFLEEEINEFKTKYQYYSNMDKNGEILLQTIALLDSKPPKKSDLPKNMNAVIYNRHRDNAVNSLDNLGKWLTDSIGLGLDSSNKLVPYDAIFAPMAVVFGYIEDKYKNTNKVKARYKLKKWFVGSVLSQRYQEGVHNKQQNDVDEFKAWIDDEKLMPKWLDDVVISPSIKRASSSGAIGKLIKCMINMRHPKDPASDEPIGFKDGLIQTEIHHIFPTKWVKKGLVDFEDEKININVALNTMFLSKQTNGDWLNFDPKTQVEQARKASSNEMMYANFETQFISQSAIEILSKSTKKMSDYESFLNARFKSFADELSQYNFKKVENEEEGFQELDESEE